jgi:MFS family permease
MYSQNLYTSFAIVFLIGVFTAAEVLVFTCAKNNASARHSGTAIALANALVMLAGSVFQPVFGVLLDLFWTGGLSSSGVRLYDISCYNKAILTLPICLVISFALSIFIKESMEQERVS